MQVNNPVKEGLKREALLTCYQFDFRKQILTVSHNSEQRKDAVHVKTGM